MPSRFLFSVLVVSLVLATIPRSSSARPTLAPATVGPADGAALPSLPRVFEPNQGQAAKEVSFVSRSTGSTALVSGAGVTLALRAPDPEAPRPEPNDVAKLTSGARFETLRMSLAGANPAARIAGDRELTSRSHYLSGPTSKHWNRDVPNYAAVRMAEVYEGVDAVWYGTHDRLEYDFVVRPGADPGRIRMKFEGQQSCSVTEDGDLLLRLRSGQVRQERPFVYQGTQKRAVAAKYVVEANGEVAIDLGAYDRSTPLVVDPALVFAEFLGGSSASDEALAVAVDSTGATYVAGITSASDFPTTSGAYGAISSSPRDDLDLFVCKLSPDGTSIVYATYLGGSEYDFLTTLAVDAQGSACVLSTSNSDDFPLTPGAFDTTPEGNGQTFLTKLSSDGGSLTYSTCVGGSEDEVFGMTVDDGGSVFVAGRTFGFVPFPTTPGAFQTVRSGSSDGFLAKLSPSGSSLIYSTYLGSSAGDSCGRVALDAAGNACVVGGAGGADFPTTPGAYDTTFEPVYAAKLNSNGSALQYSTFLPIGGIRAIVVDPGGALCIAGTIATASLFTTSGAFDTTYNGLSDAFVTKLNATGTALVYSTYLGGSDFDTALAIDVDVTGWTNPAFQTSNYPTTPGAFDTVRNGADAFVTKLTPDGSTLAYSTYLGGTETTERASDDSAAIYVPATGAWFLRYFNAPGTADATFGYGPAGAGFVPLRGDWDGDGTDTVGLYASATGAFFLKNSNGPGPADVTLIFGPGGGGIVPLAGDWDGNGADSVGLYVPATGAFFLTNENEPGPADLTFGFGPAGGGFVPLVGDWNADGADSVGLYVPASAAFFLTDENASGPANLTFIYGPPGAIPVTGDWNGDGADSVGIYVPATAGWFLRDSNAPGPADVTFIYGPPGATPLAGDWDGR